MRGERSELSRPCEFEVDILFEFAIEVSAIAAQAKGILFFTVVNDDDVALHNVGNLNTLGSGTMCNSHIPYDSNADSCQSG